MKEAIKKDILGEVQQLVDLVNGLTKEDFKDIKLPKEFNSSELVEVVEVTTGSRIHGFKRIETKFTPVDKERKMYMGNGMGNESPYGTTFHAYTREEYITKKLTERLGEIIKGLNLYHIGSTKVANFPLIQISRLGIALVDLCKEKFGITEVIDYAPAIRVPQEIMSLKESLIAG